jgi:hypothetical protein
MTFVAHLAQEGYDASAMAMILCSDPDVQGVCDLAQGLHQGWIVRDLFFRGQKGI